MEQISVLLADDHAVFREGLAGLLGREADIQVVGEAASAAEALRLTAEARPDVLVIDMQMPGGTALDALSDLLREAPDTRVVVLSGHTDGSAIAQTIKAGAAGYLSKSETAKGIVDAIRAVMRGEKALSPQASVSLAEHLHDEGASGAAAGEPDGSPLAERQPLTDREVEILRQVGEGRTNAQIGAALFLSERTVKNHVYNMYRKLGVANRASAVLKALDMGLIDGRDPG